ncbi:hypothetical protein CU098_012969 [Rhizopus stolonifer]|uniref:CCHC-type domain-containing protein n=1 Tax=Rhizopus stolonifer TaxID=4846 RepID=A0A367KUQ0_RHIST|nr:hypothetical protein CU098_012969 [Rhizopus stolonifer]
MPDICRLCQASDHCRADCPDLKNYMKCFNCNEKGHMMRQCPRSNIIETIAAPNKKAKIIVSKDCKTPVNTVKPKEVTPVTAEEKEEEEDNMDVETSEPERPKAAQETPSPIRSLCITTSETPSKYKRFRIQNAGDEVSQGRPTVTNIRMIENQQPVSYIWEQLEQLANAKLQFTEAQLAFMNSVTTMELGQGGLSDQL